jgi:signal transduction histidine kinase
VAEREIVSVNAEAIAAEVVRVHLRQSPVALFGNAVGMALVALVFGPVAEPWRLAVWFTPVALLWLLRLAHWLRFGRRAELPDAVVRDQRTRLAWLAIGQGAMWGVAAWVFWGVGGVFHNTALILMIVTYTFGAVQILGTQRRMFLIFVSVVFVPGIVRVALDTTEPHRLELAGIIVLLFVATLVMARTYRGALGDALALRKRTEQLAAQLQLEKAQAEEARRAAEAASQAKTQFFAAASHDLRQPLHAMGLFAEALRQRSHDAEVAPLVHSINESVDALEGLFGELLDITRIDSGGIELHPAPVRMKELFARLRLHFEPIAFEKGLALDFRGERHVARADPVQLERILRNLVANAIRYTEDGAVLVSCRARAGALVLQVWDTGIGIAPQNLPRIFDEFFQLQGARKPEPHQRMGMGLGLAIVKRLAALAGAPIDVRSREGHGTVFSLTVPVGRLPRAAEASPAAGAAPLALTLQGRQVVVIEDDAAVREGLAVLLRGWSAGVQAFDGLPALREWLASPPPAAPDLLIVDYRLPDGSTGVEAIDIARAHWPAARLPAIVVTGSSLVGHEDEADRHDFHVLLKPVLPNRLRAMIAFKLGVR